MRQTAHGQKPIQIAPGLGFVKRKVVAGRALGALLLGTALALGAPAVLGAQETFDYSAYGRVLEEFVTPNGNVRYAALQRNPEDLNTFIQQLAATSPENRPELFPTDRHRIAYWINAYNAFVLHQVIDDYPIESVISFRTLWGALFFKRSKHTAGGKDYSLDDIEHGLLRKKFNEPRIHFAINCASASCPVLRSEPYRGDILDRQLDEQARTFCRKQENVWMRGDVLFLSAIFDWYREDFLQALRQQGRQDPTLVDYVAQYVPEALARDIQEKNPRIEFYDYDWALNDASPARAD